MFPNPRFRFDITPVRSRATPSLASAFDHAQLPGTLTSDQGESSWFCFEGTGTGVHGSRHIAGLVWLHRTGPRPTRVSLKATSIDRNALPAPLRELLPRWLPLWSPLDFGLDERPLLMIALYDLDDPAARPTVVELPAEEIDLHTLSAVAGEGSLELHHYRPDATSIPSPLAEYVGGDTHAVAVRARTDAFSLELHGRALKPPVVFGDRGSPRLRHGRIEVSYMQRPRYEMNGTITLRGEQIRGFRAIGAHDRHWRTSTVLGLTWVWVHLRLPGFREVVAYVIRDARDGEERGRAAWIVDHDASVRRLDTFTLVATDTDSRQPPARFRFAANGLFIELAHAMTSPYVRMRAFGDVLDLGIYEAPIRVLSGDCEGGWLEIMSAS